VIEDFGDANRLEDIAENLEQVVTSMDDWFTSVGVMYQIRNGKPKWMPCTVGWYYVRRLDEEIKDLQVQLRRSVEKTQIAPETKSVQRFSGEAEKKGVSLDALKHPIRCTVVAGIVREMSHNVAAKLRRYQYPVITVARKNYCEIEHAAILWPHKRKAFEKYKQGSEE
jgi:hypothetical protein